MPRSSSRAARSAGTPESKTCRSCGRTIEWRKKWERDWDQVRYCSTSCRKRGVSDVDQQLEDTILELLERRPASSTICPSEAARAVAGEREGDEKGDEAWRDLMEPARRAARRLVERDQVEITQKGKVVDPSTARGPIRIRRVR